MAKYIPPSEQIRRLIEQSGLTRREMCEVLSIGRSALSRVLSGERGLSMEVLDRLGELLQLRITSGKDER